MTETEDPHNIRKKWYNLRPKPSKVVQFTLTQTNNQLVMSVPKTHTHIILTQLKLKDEIKASETKQTKHIEQYSKN